MANRTRRLFRLVVALAIAVFLPSAAQASAAQVDPLFVFAPAPLRPGFPPVPPLPPPHGNFDGLCGVAVDSKGDFYVSDYYRHAVDAYEPTAAYGLPPQVGSIGYIGQLAGVDMLDGPCGLAFDGSDNLYVNSFHRSVIRYGALPSFGAGMIIAGGDLDGATPTGVAADATTGRVYVDVRTGIAVYDSTGSQVVEAGQPLRIGAGTLEDGQGVAVSEYPGTQGQIYVPDAGSNTVKIFDPSVDQVDPIAEIDGGATPDGHFVSLRDSAIAIDRVSGEVYVVDNSQPHYTESPEGIVYVFGPEGSYEGHLQYMVRDALPPGLAVDNSASPTYPAGTQGRLYVTSGSTEGAAVYGYGPGAATNAAPKPPAYPLTLFSTGGGAGKVTSDIGQMACSTECMGSVHAGATVSLTATAEPGSVFTGWSGDCAGDSPSCAVRMQNAISARAGFARVEAPDEERGIAAPAIPLTPSAALPQAQSAPENRAAKHRKRRRHRVKHAHRTRRTREGVSR